MASVTCTLDTRLLYLLPILHSRVRLVDFALACYLLQSPSNSSRRRSTTVIVESERRRILARDLRTVIVESEPKERGPWSRVGYILDEIDSGLDALQHVAKAEKRLLTPENSLLTHYQHLLNYIKPTLIVSVFATKPIFLNLIQCLNVGDISLDNLLKKRKGA